jgi:hypothetical protein
MNEEIEMSSDETFAPVTAEPLLSAAEVTSILGTAPGSLETMAEWNRLDHDFTWGQQKLWRPSTVLAWIEESARSDNELWDLHVYLARSRTEGTRQRRVAALDQHGGVRGEIQGEVAA